MGFITDVEVQERRWYGNGSAFSLFFHGQKGNEVCDQLQPLAAADFIEGECGPSGLIVVNGQGISLTVNAVYFSYEGEAVPVASGEINGEGFLQCFCLKSALTAPCADTFQG